LDRATWIEELEDDVESTKEYMKAEEVKGYKIVPKDDV